MATNLTRCVIFLFVLLMAGPAWAQASQEDEAEGFYKSGAEAYFSGDYAAAISNFKRAHELAPNPMFLYNLSLAYGKLGNFPEAIDHAERAVEGGLPDVVQHKSASRLAGFQTRVMAEEVASSIARPAGHCESDSECDSDTICDLDENICIADVDEDTPGESSSGLGAAGWSGIGLLAASGGLFVGAILMDMQAADIKDDYDSTSAGAERDQLAEDYDDKRSTGQILLFSGIGAAVVGTGLLTWDLMSDDEGSASLAPLIAPDSAGVRLSGSF